jgi:hypothetical protein
MKSILSATVCAAAMAFAIPAIAATDDAPVHHHHHMMHGKHSGMMRKGSSGDNAETAKLNEQSLANAKGGVMPASSSSSTTSGMAPTGSGMAPTGSGMAPTGSGMSAPGSAMAPSSSSTTPASGGAMAAPGTGMAAPSSGAMGNAMPGNAPATTTPDASAPNGK